MAQVQTVEYVKWTDLQFQIVASLPISHSYVINGQDVQHTLRCEVIVDQLQVLRS